MIVLLEVAQCSSDYNVNRVLYSGVSMTLLADARASGANHLLTADKG